MIARNILIVIAIIMILFNAMSYIYGNINMPDSMEGKIGYMIGRNFLILLSLILLLIAYFLHKKGKRKREKKMIDTFLE